MNSQPRKISKQTFEKTDELIRIGADAVKRAQDESRELEVPNVYSINGQIYHETEAGLVRDDATPDSGE